MYALGDGDSYHRPLILDKRSSFGREKKLWIYRRSGAKVCLKSLRCALSHTILSQICSPMSVGLTEIPLTNQMRVQQKVTPYVDMDANTNPKPNPNPNPNLKPNLNPDPKS